MAKRSENRYTTSVANLIKQLQALPKSAKLDDRYRVSIFNDCPAAKELGLKKKINLELDF